MRKVIATAAALMLAAASPALAAEGHDHHDDHVSVQGQVRAVHAWTRATSGSTAYVFVEIENRGTVDVDLLGGESPVAATVTLVGFVLKDGKETYTPLPHLPVKAGGDVVLAPNGLALRLDGLSTPLEEHTVFDLDIRLSTGVLDVHVAVEDASAVNHSHAGHAH